MIKNKKILLALSIIIVIAIVLIILLLKNNTSEFIIDSENKYIVETNMKFLTMQNDGGSHINIYYGIDLEAKKVYKYEDSYKGFEGYKYKGKIVNKKSLTEEEVASLKALIDSIISKNVETNDTKNLFNYYTLLTQNDNEIKIYDQETISKLVELLE